MTGCAGDYQPAPWRTEDRRLIRKISNFLASAKKDRKKGGSDMRRKMQAKVVCYLIGLTILIWWNLALGQPAMQYYNVTGLDFISNCLTGGKQHTSYSCFRKDSCSGFSFPVNLQNGSVIKYIELFFIRHDQSMILNYNYLDLLKIDPGVSEPGLISIQDSGPTGAVVQKKKSNEMNEIVDNQNYFYKLFYYAFSQADVEFCGARIYYYPPSGMGYLPLIIK
jgi:hypothetical protein